MRNPLKPKHWRWGAFSFALLFQMISLAAMSQVKISGKVTTPDGKGAPFISVLIKNTTIGTSTDANGVYSLNADIKPGTYTLEISGVGYKTATQTLTIGNAVN